VYFEDGVSLVFATVSVGSKLFDFEPVTVLNTLNEGYKRNIGVLPCFFVFSKYSRSTPIFLL
jgi:hypothetical protein